MKLHLVSAKDSMKLHLVSAKDSVKFHLFKFLINAEFTNNPKNKNKVGKELNTK